MSMSVNQSQHRHVDTNLTVTKVLPAAGANNNTDSIDTRSGANAIIVAGSQTATYTGNAALEEMELRLTMPATDSLVNTKSVTFTVYDSADDSSFAAVTALGAQVVTGAGGNVSAETELRWKLPSSIRRYVRVNQSVPADAGDVTDTTCTLSLLS